MPLATFPAFAWGSAVDISALSQNGTATVTSSVADPFGGTSAYTIADDDAGASEYRIYPFTPTYNGTQWFILAAKASTATASDVVCFDTAGGGATRATLRLTWSGGVPTASIAAGSGTALTPVSVGSGWYLCLFSADNVVTSGTNRLRLHGATSTAASTGATSYYLRHMVLTDLLDNAVSFERGADGSDYVQAPSLVEDSWEVTESVLQGDLRWVPRVPQSNPVVVSGWEGGSEAVGVNDGVRALLKAGRTKSALTWVKDRSDCATNQSCYLSQPMTEAPGLEQDGYSRTVRIELRGSATFVGI